MVSANNTLVVHWKHIRYILRCALQTLCEKYFLSIQHFLTQHSVTLNKSPFQSVPKRTPACLSVT